MFKYDASIYLHYDLFCCLDNYSSQNHTHFFHLLIKGKGTIINISLLRSPIIQHWVAEMAL